MTFYLLHSLLTINLVSAKDIESDNKYLHNTVTILNLRNKYSRLEQESLNLYYYLGRYTNYYFQKSDSNGESGFFNSTELDFAIGIGNSKEYKSVGICTINGYNFRQHLAVGIGFGLDKYSYATLLPVFIDCKITNFSFENSLLIIGCSIGYSFDLSGYLDGYYHKEINNRKWGPMKNPYIGLQIPVFLNKQLVIKIGIKQQGNTIPYLNMVIPRDQYFINTKVGFEF